MPVYRKPMTVQTFKARSIQEALQMVRESLGPEATILETRTVFAGLLPWFRRPSHVIVSASCEVKIPSHLPPTICKSLVASPAQTVDILNAFPRPPSNEDSQPLDVGKPLLVAASYVEQLYQLEQQTHTSDHSVAETPSTRCADPVVEHFTHRNNAAIIDSLQQAGLSATAIEELIQLALNNNPLATGEMLKQEINIALSRLIETTAVLSGSGLQSLDKIKTDRILFYGLSGVGKSTTIAKLATQLQLRQDRTVAVIDLSTMLASEATKQNWLRAHLQKLGIDCISCTDPESLKHALLQFQNKDYVLFDTPGICIKSKARHNWFKKILPLIKPQRSHLVCATTCHAHHIQDLLAAPIPVHPTSFVLTKLDETRTVGHLFTLLQETDLPISLLTTGPELTDNFEDVNPQRLAQFITKMTPTEPTRLAAVDITNIDLNASETHYNDAGRMPVTVHTK
jgi:flagellar biosynthesis protein FlhF